MVPHLLVILLILSQAHSEAEIVFVGLGDELRQVKICQQAPS
jgi:hypothetical protein